MTTKNQSYLDNPALFKKGQADGVQGTCTILTKIVDGTDHGTGRVADKNLEKIRRVLLLWRDHIIESKDKNPKALNVLLETKKIMDIKVP
jgi:hypothetical protein